MTRPFPPRSSHVLDRTPFTITEFEPLLDSTQAAQLLRIHPKTLQKMARRGDIHGTHVGKLWRFRASDLNDWIYRQDRAS
jgi:excisionase family DNA binding protein